MNAVITSGKGAAQVSIARAVGSDRRDRATTPAGARLGPSTSCSPPPRDRLQSNPTADRGFPSETPPPHPCPDSRPDQPGPSGADSWPARSGGPRGRLEPPSGVEPVEPSPTSAKPVVTAQRHPDPAPAASRPGHQCGRSPHPSSPGRRATPSPRPSHATPSSPPAPAKPYRSKATPAHRRNPPAHGARSARRATRRGQGGQESTPVRNGVAPSPGHKPRIQGHRAMTAPGDPTHDDDRHHHETARSTRTRAEGRAPVRTAPRRAGSDPRSRGRSIPDHEEAPMAPSIPGRRSSSSTISDPAHGQHRRRSAGSAVPTAAPATHQPIAGDLAPLFPMAHRRGGLGRARYQIGAGA